MKSSVEEVAVYVNIIVRNIMFDASVSNLRRSLEGTEVTV